MGDAVWELDDHTRAKHVLLETYLKAWFPILAHSGQRRFIFLDGFAGPGIYSDGEPGSPLIALQTLIEHDHFVRWDSTEFIFVFVESNGPRFRNLVAQIESYWDSIGGKPSNIYVEHQHATFADVAKDIIDEVQGRLAPTLAFIDPFGWSGVPMRLIGELLSADKCEVIFNFMFDAVNRFVNDDRPGIANTFADLFGTTGEEHREAGVLAGEERKEFLRDLYVSQLKQVAKFTHVRPFEMMDIDRNRTAYYLMYGTRHARGLRAMKEAMWKVAPIDGIRFSGFAGDQPMLFELEPDFVPLRRALCENFKSLTVPVDEVERFVLLDTDYLTTHYKRVLKELETQGRIECSNRKKLKTYPSGTTIKFL